MNKKIKQIGKDLLIGISIAVVVCVVALVGCILTGGGI